MEAFANKAAATDMVQIKKLVSKYTAIGK